MPTHTHTHTHRRPIEEPPILQEVSWHRCDRHRHRHRHTDVDTDTQTET